MESKFNRMFTDLYNCSGSWKSASFKSYNFEALGAPSNGGALHPLLKVREEFRNIFLEMGFVVCLSAIIHYGL